jgi:hypothetical protein
MEVRRDVTEIYLSSFTIYVIRLMAIGLVLLLSGSFEAGKHTKRVAEAGDFEKRVRPRVVELVH